MSSIRILSCILLCVVAAGCDDDPPTSPTPSGGLLTIGAVTPASGGSVTTTGTPPGAFIARGSGQVSIPMTIAAGRELPWAQLNVYLVGSDGVPCGQNLPDSPTWGPFRASDTVTVTVTGFQVWRVPCTVASVRAFLHTRNNGLLIEPSASETAAQGTATASFTIR